jgi:hypothetical protein
MERSINLLRLDEAGVPHFPVRECMRQVRSCEVETGRFKTRHMGHSQALPNQPPLLGCCINRSNQHPRSKPNARGSARPPANVSLGLRRRERLNADERQARLRLRRVLGCGPRRGKTRARFSAMAERRRGAHGLHQPTPRHDRKPERRIEDAVVGTLTFNADGQTDPGGFAVSGRLRGVKLRFWAASRCQASFLVF